MVAAEAGLGAKNTARTATDLTSCLHGRVWFRLFSASHDLPLARANLRRYGSGEITSFCSTMKSIYIALAPPAHLVRESKDKNLLLKAKWSPPGWVRGRTPDPTPKICCEKTKWSPSRWVRGRMDPRPRHRRQAEEPSAQSSSIAAAPAAFKMSRCRNPARRIVRRLKVRGFRIVNHARPIAELISVPLTDDHLYLRRRRLVGGSR